MRRNKEVSDDVLSRAGRYQRVYDTLEVKEVVVDGRRYVVCKNEQEARKDAAARATLIAKLEETLDRHGPKAVIGNKGFARFLKVAIRGLRQAILERLNHFGRALVNRPG